MQLFLSYADLPSLEVIKCDEVALDLVENTWTSRSGIECRLVIQLTRDSRVYIARGVRDTLLAVISSRAQYTRTIVTRMHAARSKVMWHNASIRGDYRDISRTGASASYLHRTNVRPTGARFAASEVPPLMQKSNVHQRVITCEHEALDVRLLGRYQQKQPIYGKIKNVRDKRIKQQNKWINYYTMLRRSSFAA